MDKKRAEAIKARKKQREADTQQAISGKVGNCVKCGNNKPLEGADIIAPSLIPRILCADCKRRTQQMNASAIASDTTAEPIIPETAEQYAEEEDAVETEEDTESSEDVADTDES
jgi:hypothetical protein